MSEGVDLDLRFALANLLSDPLIRYMGLVRNYGGKDTHILDQ
jgi:hypothetical protein